ncbi:MAG: hypothetical protein QM757_14760 [Paludibaculum sp.]
MIVPHITITTHLVDPRPVEYWYAFDLDQLEHCDAVLRLPGPSIGADNEIEHAEGLGIPVFYDQDDLVAWAHQRAAA